MTTPQRNVETFTSMIKNIPTDYDDETEQNCDTECVENVTSEKNENVTPHYDEEIPPQNDNQYQYMIKDYHEAAAQNNENLAKQCNENFNENLTPQYNKPNIQVSQHNITAQNNVTPQAYAMPIVYERPFNRPMFGNQYSSTTFSPSRGRIAQCAISSANKRDGLGRFIGKVMDMYFTREEQMHNRVNVVNRVYKNERKSFGQLDVSKMFKVKEKVFRMYPDEVATLKESEYNEIINNRCRKLLSGAR